MVCDCWTGRSGCTRASAEAGARSRGLADGFAAVCRTAGSCGRAGAGAAATVACPPRFNGVDSVGLSVCRSSPRAMVTFAPPRRSVHAGVAVPFEASRSAASCSGSSSIWSSSRTSTSCCRKPALSAVEPGVTSSTTRPAPRASASCCRKTSDARASRRPSVSACRDAAATSPTDWMCDRRGCAVASVAVADGV